MKIQFTVDAQKAVEVGVPPLGGRVCTAPTTQPPLGGTPTFSNHFSAA